MRVGRSRQEHEDIAVDVHERCVTGEGFIGSFFTPARSVLAIFTLALPLVMTSAAAEPLDYTNSSHWICRPDLDDVYDGTLTVQPLKANPEAPIDCFYIYPTVSRDTSLNSDTNWGQGEEIWATFVQAAPLGGMCRLFAHGYRQLTIDGLTANNFLPNDFAYNDVLAAWRTYLEHETTAALGPRANDIPGDMAPEWGTHLVDVNVVRGNLQRLVTTQGAAWLALHQLSEPRRSDGTPMAK